LSKNLGQPGFIPRNCLAVSHRSRLTGSALWDRHWGGTVAVSPHGDSAMNDAFSPDSADTLPFTGMTPYGRPSWSGLLHFSLVGIPPGTLTSAPLLNNVRLSPRESRQHYLISHGHGHSGVLPIARGGEGFLRNMFEPLGYAVEATRWPVQKVPPWSFSP